MCPAIACHVSSSHECLSTVHDTLDNHDHAILARLVHTCMYGPHSISTRLSYGPRHTLASIDARVPSHSSWLP
jgi:hypothetical protein